jgi:glucose/arabinose dehydrogenase/PKD repeat protein
MTRREPRGMAVAILALGALITSCTSDQEPLAEVQSTITLPPNFTDGLVASVGSPTALAFLPDGRLLVTTQAGQVRVVRDGSLRPTPALSLGSSICSNFERGLLGVAIDPDFATTRHVFLFFTGKRPNGDCANNSLTTSPVGRVARYTYNLANDTLDPASAVVILDAIPAVAGNHNGGDIHFGADGFLYVSVGDSGCEFGDTSRCGGTNRNALHKSHLAGKILRVAKDGSVPSSNPWVGQPGARRCGAPGAAPIYDRDSNRPCTETFAWGLRNPFRIAFRPGSNDFFINDVGQNKWEEIDEGIAGANYGWNTREGNCARDSATNCGDPPAGLTNPIHAYGGDNRQGCVSITGGAFVPGSVFGAGFQDSYLFGDYGCGKIFTLTQSGSGWTASDFATAMGQSSVTSMRFGPSSSSSGQSLYYTTFGGGGQVRRIDFTGSGNRAPTASFTATPTAGPRPLDVSFDGRASSDPDGDALRYRWTFGNGDTVETTTPTTTFRYNTAGQFTASLVVTDGRGGQSSPVTAVIRVGSPPTVSITAPAADTEFTVGQIITLSATASDPEDGNLPASALSWEVLRHHDSHTHPYFSGTGNNLIVEAPPPEDLLAATNSFLGIRVRATDSSGLTTDVIRDIYPRTVDLTFASQPAGVRATLDGVERTTPATIVAWINWGLRVSAPLTFTDAQGQVWTFSRWSDGGAAEHVITTPASDTTYTATYTQGGFAAKINFQPDGAAVPAGYVADTGAAFGDRGGGLSFGWNAATSETRERNVHSDQRHDTLNHMQKPSNANARWEIAVPSGSYEVKVVMGDASHFDSTFRLAAEGRQIVNGTPTSANRFVEATATVTVSDGRLTLTNAPGAVNNKINFVDIRKL